MKKRKQIHTNNLTFGLFQSHGRYWYLNIRDVKTLFSRIIFTLKHGYAPQATWETFDWFINVMDDILCHYRDHRYGTPLDMETEEYTEVLNHMVQLLKQMDETNYVITDNPEQYLENYSSMKDAKDKFFKLFSEHFYDLWD